jgi:signal transduction histidine kinase
MSSAGTQLETEDPVQTKLQVLLVEDNERDAELMLRELRREGFDLCSAVVQTPDGFRKRVKEEMPDIILADYNLGQWRGIEALEILQADGLDIPVIMVTGALGDVAAAHCIKQGATDYVLKDGLARLPEAIRGALRAKRERSLRHRAEADLSKKVDELARSNADLEQFAYIASHDLQEPLRMVTAYTQLLAERYRGQLDDTADKFIGYASEGAERMQVLIQDLLAFSRVGRNGVGSVSVDCNALMDELLLTLEPAIRESGTVINRAQLPVVWADRTQVAQVFQNLIANAIKFRGKDSPVVSVEVEKVDQQWQFSVSDNGIGIAPEYAENIFVVFQRLHARSEYPGNGIGLAICKKIVEHYGGKIWVEPRAGSGSTFKFTLPSEAPGRNERSSA